MRSFADILSPVAQWPVNILCLDAVVKMRQLNYMATLKEDLH